MTLFGDSEFGIRLEPVEEGRLFRIGLELHGEVIGDLEPAIPWSCLSQWTRLPVATDPRLDPNGRPEVLYRLLRSDESLHESFLSGVAESFDAWSIHAYRFNGNAVFVVGPEQETPRGDRVVVASLPEGRFQAIAAEALSAYEAAAR